MKDLNFLVHQKRTTGLNCSLPNQSFFFLPAKSNTFINDSLRLLQFGGRGRGLFVCLE